MSRSGRLLLASLLLWAGPSCARAVESAFPVLDQGHADLKKDMADQRAAQQRENDARDKAQDGQTIEFYGRGDVDVVKLYVSVRNTTGKELNRNAFRIFETHPANNVPLAQDIRSFEVAYDRPLTLGILIDVSGSLWRSRDKLVKATECFIKHSNPDDEIFAVPFANKYFLYKGDYGDNVDGDEGSRKFLKTAAELEKFMREKVHIAKGRTVLYDTVNVAAPYARENGSADLKRKALLLITDGDDDEGIADPEQEKEREKTLLTEAVQSALANKMQIFAFGIPNPLDADGDGRRNLEKLARSTAGTDKFLKSNIEDVSDKEIESVCEDVNKAMRTQYALTYRPKITDRDGTLRKIEVQVRDSHGQLLEASYENEYRAPKDAE